MYQVTRIALHGSNGEDSADRRLGRGDDNVGLVVDMFQTPQDDSLPRLAVNLGIFGSFNVQTLFEPFLDSEEEAIELGLVLEAINVLGGVRVDALEGFEEFLIKAVDKRDNRGTKSGNVFAVRLVFELLDVLAHLQTWVFVEKGHHVVDFGFTLLPEVSGHVTCRTYDRVKVAWDEVKEDEELHVWGLFR